MTRARQLVAALENAANRRRHDRVGAQLGDNVVVARGSSLTSTTSIADNVWINGIAQFKGSGKITIGSWTAVGSELIIATSNHDMSHPNMVLSLHREHGFVDLKQSADVEIGPGCWIGDRVVILGGARIGAGCVLAAGAVVPGKDYPPYSVLGGNPAKVIRRRATDEVADALCRSRWWTWDSARRARNRAFFEADISATSAQELSELIHE